MSPIATGYKWAAGFSNTSGLKAIERDVPTFMGKPFYVHGQGSWDEGITHMRADKLISTTGFQRFTLIADVMSDVQYNYIQATYSPGGTGLSAKMTVRTLNRSGSFANYSAVLHLPKKSDLQRVWNAFRAVPLLFIVEAAL